MIWAGHNPGAEFRFDILFPDVEVEKFFYFILQKLVGQAGLEPATCGLGIRHSVQLSYWPVKEIQTISEKWLLGKCGLDTV